MKTSSETRTGLAGDEIKQAFLENLRCGMGRPRRVATPHDLYYALALTIRDRVFDRAVASMETIGGNNSRRVAYLSAEFLPGPHLGNNLLNLGITGAAREALASLGYDLDEILDQEEEPGLGNGGLGRLASCYMDSLATVEVPAVGYGIRYERLPRKPLPRCSIQTTRRTVARCCASSSRFSSPVARCRTCCASTCC